MKEIGLSKDTHNKSSLRDRYNALNQHSLFYRLFHLAPIFLLIFFAGIWLQNYLSCGDYPIVVAICYQCACSSYQGG